MKIILGLLITSLLLSACQKDSKDKLISGSPVLSTAQFEGSWVGPLPSSYVNIGSDGATVSGNGVVGGSSFSFTGSVVNGNTFSGGGVSGQLLPDGNLSFTRGSTTVQMDRR